MSKTPESFYQAVREFREPTLEYAPASGLPAYIDAVRGYYAKLGVKLEREDILATSGGGEALEFVHGHASWTTATSCWCRSLSTPTTIPLRLHERRRRSGPFPPPPEEGYRFADRKARIESQINERTRGNSW